MALQSFVSDFGFKQKQQNMIYKLTDKGIEI